MKICSGIYKIENLKNSKLYIGSAVNMKSRWATHKSNLQAGIHANKKLQNAWNKHGKDAFKFVALIFCERKDLIFYEQRFMDSLKSVDFGYNVLPIAGSGLGYKHSDDHKKNMLGNKHALGMVHSEETKEKIAKSCAGNKNSLGHKHKPEFGKRISQRLIGIAQSEDHVAKRMAAHIGTKRTEQAKENMRAAWVKRKELIALNGK